MSATRIISYHHERGSFWFRVFGIGLSLQDRRVHPALFSERNGFVRVLRVGPYSIKALRP